MLKPVSIVRWAALLFMVLLVLSAAACTSSAATQTPNEQTEPTEEPAKPSNPGGPGEAVNLKGDPQQGQQVFQTNCVVCHGEQGKGGIPNPGSADGTVPELNPIDPTLVSANDKTFATNLDLFIQHGSTPEGDSPEKSMLAFGDNNTLTQQQIADVIAYVISLNR